MKFKYKVNLLLLFALIAVFNNAKAQTITADSILGKEISTDRPEINIGFGKQQKLHITGAIATKNGSSLKTLFTNNIGNALHGKLAGLTVSQGGSEAGNNTPGLNIRGNSTYSTFNLSNDPLIIVDGFITDYFRLVPEEIEEISILKDAASTAVYGMRGANGVVLVTTKKGKVKPLAIEFNAQYGRQSFSETPKFLGAYDYATLYNEALTNDGKAPLYTQADLNLYQDGTDPFFHPNVNWYNEVFRNSSPFANYNLNFSGGNNTVKYFALLSAVTSQGMFKKFGDYFNESSNANYNRYNFRTNVEVNLNKTLTAQLNVGASFDDKTNPGTNINTDFSLIDRIPANAFPVYNANGSIGGNSTYASNPAADLSSTGFTGSNATTLQTSLRLSQQLNFITKGLTASIAVSFNNYFLSQSRKTKTYQRISAIVLPNGDTSYSTRFGQRTVLAPSESILSQYRNSAIQADLSYNRIFGKHALTGLVLFNSDGYFINKTYPNTDAANQAFPYKSNSVSTRLTYVNNDKYIVSFSGSYMGTENYAPGKRYGFFPAASIGWVASNESFLKKSAFVNLLKVRASYGIVGNDNVGGQRFAFTQRFPFGASYWFGAGNTLVNSISEGRRANDDVTWEKEKKTNIGIDFNFLNHFELVVDVFKNERYDILASASSQLPGFLGYNGFPDLNSGKVENNGFEMSLKYNTSAKAKVQFFVEGMVSYAKNNILFNGEQFQLNKNLYRTGTAIGQPFGLIANGLFQSQAEIDASPKPLGVIIRPGDIKYQDIGGPQGTPDGIIDNNDVAAFGKTSLPEWTFGLETGFAYKGFDLNLFFQGISGISRNLSGSRYFAFQNFGQISNVALDRWNSSNTGANYPRLSADNNQNNYRFSSFWERDASFIKLRSAEIGYTLPATILKRMHLSQTRFYVNGTNLFTIDKIKDADAEAITGYPMLRTVSFGLKLTL